MLDCQDVKKQRKIWRIKERERQRSRKEDKTPTPFRWVFWGHLLLYFLGFLEILEPNMPTKRGFSHIWSSQAFRSCNKSCLHGQLHFPRTQKLWLHNLPREFSLAAGKFHGSPPQKPMPATNLSATLRPWSFRFALVTWNRRGELSTSLTHSCAGP